VEPWVIGSEVVELFQERNVTTKEKKGCAIDESPESTTRNLPRSSNRLAMWRSSCCTDYWIPNSLKYQKLSQ